MKQVILVSDKKLDLKVGIHSRTSSEFTDEQKFEFGSSRVQVPHLSNGLYHCFLEPRLLAVSDGHKVCSTIRTLVLALVH